MEVKMYLRLIQHSDCELLFAWYNSAAVTLYLPSLPYPLTWEHHKAWFNCIETGGDPTRLDLMVVEKNRTIGRVHATEYDTSEPEVGIVIGAIDWWGKGLATEAVSRFLKIVREKHPGAKALIHPENGASQKVFSRCGFQNSLEKGRKGQDIWRRAFWTEDGKEIK